MKGVRLIAGALCALLMLAVPVMADDAQMPHQSPVGLPVYHGADHHQRGGIQGQFSADILLHFKILLLF